MIRRCILVLIVACWCTFTHAYDFTADGIAYTITSLSKLECEVVRNDTPYEGKIVIPSKVQYKNKELTVTSIGRYAFADCRALVSIKLPESITDVGTCAFENCTSLESIDLSMLESIPYGMFEGCESLQNVTFGKSLTSIERKAFYGCVSLADVQIKDTPLESIAVDAFNGCKKLSSIVFGESLTSIESGAFANTGIKDFVVPNSVTSIGGEIVSGENLESLTIGNGITELKYNPIDEDVHLNKLIFVDGEKDLQISFYVDDGTKESYYYYENNQRWRGYYYFYSGGFSLAKIDTLYIGRCIESKGKTENTSDYHCAPFCNNSNIKSVTFSTYGRTCSGGNTYLERGGKYLNKTYPTFKNCKALESVTFLANAGCSEVFRGCTALKQVKCSGFSLYCFEGCTALENVYLDSTTSHISNFKDCDNLSNIYCMAPTPPKCESGDETFSNKVYLNCNLYVPQSSLSSYQQTAPWKYFWNIIAVKDITDITDTAIPDVKISIADGCINVSGKHSNQEIRVYDMQGVLIAVTKSNTVQIGKQGIYIIKIGNFTRKVCL